MTDVKSKKCPNCGACSECGAAPTPPQIVPMPYPVYPNPWGTYPYRPYRNPYPYATWTVANSTSPQATSGGLYQ